MAYIRTDHVEICLEGEYVPAILEWSWDEEMGTPEYERIVVNGRDMDITPELAAEADLALKEKYCE